MRGVAVIDFDLDHVEAKTEGVTRYPPILFVRPGRHVHPCPECYEDKACGWYCSASSADYYDEADETVRGDISVCAACGGTPNPEHESTALAALRGSLRPTQ